MLHKKSAYESYLQPNVFTGYVPCKVRFRKVKIHSVHVLFITIA